MGESLLSSSHRLSAALVAQEANDATDVHPSALPNDAI